LITAVVNHKGGVGKTTTTLEVGTLLTRAGRRVLLVDLDPQSTLTLAAGYRPAQTAQMPTVYEVLRDGVDPATAILATAHGPSLLPAKIAMSQADLTLNGAFQREFLLREALGKLAGYDHVFLDCSPSLGLLTINALAAADRVLVPCQTQFYALTGLVQLLDTVRLVRERLNPRLADPMILPTMRDRRVRHDREAEAKLRELYPDLVLAHTIPATSRVRDAQLGNQPVTTYDPSHPAADAYRRVAEVLDAA
jgi:chromosome partitioning protein